MPEVHASQLAVSSSGFFPTLIVFCLVIIILMAIFRARTASRIRRLRQARSPSQNSASSGLEATRRSSDVRAFIYALRNPDWEARSAAALALGIYGDQSVVHVLVNTLLTDKNEAVRENAAQSLNRIDPVNAVDPLIKVIMEYVRGAEECTKLAVTSAHILGESNSPNALNCLRNLREFLDKKGLQPESEGVAAAVNKIQSSTQVAGKKCCVCNLPFRKGDRVVRCPACGNVAHRGHMLEWLHVRGSCPVCQARVQASALQES
ncbi:MAG: HEAT repeat domain-containing protein [Promethearchaeati archaeon SRVP18_Atabeyarchaeia-1]